MSFSKYPLSLDDSTSLPPTVDLVTPVKAEVVNRLRDAIISIEAELGTDPSRTFGNVRDRLDSLKTTLTQVQINITSINSELGSNPSGSFDTVAARLNNIDALIASLQAQVDGLTAALATAAEVVTPIVSGLQVVDSTTFTTIGACVLNPTNLGHPAVTFDLEVILQTSDVSYAASFELFNITEGTIISHPSVTTSSASPTFITVSLTVGGSDLPASQNNVLEGRIKLASGAAPADRAICKYAAIRSKP